ncbi:hypothetical protein ANO11243_080360 [Dothideomycetidae sp. 11243]|nr:hypothetical protein ANO11243_080360 [fungal sp. No.11243]
MTALSSTDQAIQTICAKELHQALWLPETALHPRLRVTYSTTINFHDTTLPVILFIGPMFGTRYVSLQAGKLARECGVRLICIDRPGFGGSTPVGLDVRMQVWLETVPVLLQKVGVKQIAALLTHSAGTVYTLNTLAHYRSILDPKAPFVAFLVTTAPWVPIPHSNGSVSGIASKLPGGMLDSFAGLATFMNTKVMPSASWSGGIISSSVSLLSRIISTDVPEAAAAANSTTEYEQYGFDDETAKLIKKTALKFQFAESVAGANEEVKFCLRKGDVVDWGLATDYKVCIDKIASNEAEHHTQTSHSGARLCVQACFAESDIMIADRGQKYFEDCWRSETVGSHVDFETRTLPGTDHDSIIGDLKKGAMRSVFERIAQLGKESGAQSTG